MDEREMAELGAQPKKRRVERIEMGGSFLCFMTTRNMFLIQLSNLKNQEEVKDWTCLSPLNIHSSLELPERNLFPFEFDSKIYMAPAGVCSWSRESFRSTPIYEFNFKEKEIKHTKSLKPAPVIFESTFITNISGCGDVYFYLDSRIAGQPPILMVLSAATKDWELLHPNLPFTGKEGRSPMRCCMFALHGKIMLTSSRLTSQFYWTLFDPITKSWTEKPDGDYNICSLIRRERNQVYFTCVPQFAVSVPGLSNSYSVALSHTFVEPPEIPMGFKARELACVKVTAFMVNQNGRVALFQHLDKCFEGITPTLLLYNSIIFRILDLGDGKLCALLYGFTMERHMERHIRILCVSIFTLSLLNDALQLPVFPPMERDFLQVTVHGKSAYALPPEEVRQDFMDHAFVWPPIKGARFHRLRSYFCTW